MDMGMSGARVVIVVLAVYRLTRLVVADVVLERPRRAIQRRVRASIAYLLGCPWCVSVYVAAGVVTVTIVWPTNRVVYGVTLALAASAGAGLLSRLDDEDVGVPDDDGSS